MRRGLLVLAVLTTLIFGLFITQLTKYDVAYATYYQCDQGWNNYSDPQNTFGGVRLWGALCMQYPTSSTWGGIVETRSSQWAYIGAESKGWDQCGNGSWVLEFDAYSGQLWANYVTANASGREEECDGLGHTYYVASIHYIGRSNPSGFQIVRQDP